MSKLKLYGSLEQNNIPHAQSCGSFYCSAPFVLLFSIPIRVIAKQTFAEVLHSPSLAHGQAVDLYGVSTKLGRSGIVLSRRV